jgi:AraC-like DNA-binding protein
MVDQKPWYQKKKFDTSFPFLLTDDALPGFPFHWHEFIEVIYVRKGKLLAVVEGQIYEVMEKDILVINSGLIHGFLDQNSSNKVCIFQFGLDIFDQSLPELRTGTYKELVFGKETLISAEKHKTIHGYLEEILLTIWDEYRQMTTGFRLAVKIKLYEMALMFLREMPGIQQTPKETERRSFNHKILERVFSFIYENYDDTEITLNQAADAAALSKFYFVRFFKDQTGQTFHSYLSRLRIKKVEEYLMESDMSITDIAYACGFASLKTFNRLFKKYTGSSPSSYRLGKNSRSRNNLGNF